MRETPTTAPEHAMTQPTTAPRATARTRNARQKRTVGKPTAVLMDALRQVITSKHPYVNPTLKRLATSAKERMAKL